MKKCLFIFGLVILITGCDVGIDLPSTDGINSSCPGGWIEDGSCCKAEYSGVNVDEDGNCPGSQLPGSQIHHSTNNNYCYVVHCDEK